jgi:hypothetical protein
MAKAKRDDVAAREEWIQMRLGERKYRQLRMHLSGALRLLGELAATHENPSNPKTETTEAMAALTERLRALSRGQRAIPIRELPHAKGRKRTNPR